MDECRKSGCYGEGLMVDLLKENKIGLKVDLHTADNSFISLGEGSTSTAKQKLHYRSSLWLLGAKEK